MRWSEKNSIVKKHIIKRHAPITNNWARTCERTVARDWLMEKGIFSTPRRGNSLSDSRLQFFQPGKCSKKERLFFFSSHCYPCKNWWHSDVGIFDLKKTQNRGECIYLLWLQMTSLKVHFFFSVDFFFCVWIFFLRGLFFCVWFDWWQPPPNIEASKPHYPTCNLYTRRNIFGILLNQTEIRLYLPFNYLFVIKRTLSIRFQINWEMVNTIRFRFDFKRFQ